MALEIVSKNTDADIAQREAAEEVEQATRQLAANILRVIRGAGKAYEIGHQAIALARAVIAHDEPRPSRPHTFPIQAALTSDEPRPAASHRDDLSRALEYETEAIIRGALQIVASRLVGQRTQETAGETELMNAVRRLHTAYEVARKERAAAAKLAKKKPSRNRAARALRDG